MEAARTPSSFEAAYGVMPVMVMMPAAAAAAAVAAAAVVAAAATAVDVPRAHVADIVC